MTDILDISHNKEVLDISNAGIGNGGGVDVRDYGAKGDGIHDDTAAIQAALDEERNIFFPAGTYIIDPTTGINVETGTWLHGEGMYRTLFQVKPGVNVLNNILKVEDAGGVLLEDFAIDGNKTTLSTDREVSTNYGVYLSNSPESRVNRVRVYNMTGVGIHVYNSIATSVTNCITSDNEYHGYELEQTQNCLLAGNDAHGNIRHAVFVSPGEVGGTGAIGNVITENIFYNNQQYGVAFGIDAAGASIGLTRENVVSNNIIRNNSHYGVSIYRVDSVTVTGNLIDTNGKTGVYIYRSHRNLIANNRIRHNSAEGAGLYDEVTLEGATDGEGSFHNMILNNFIELGASNSETNANWAIREADVGDGSNVIKNNYVPWAGESGKIQVLNSNTTYEFIGDDIENELSIRGFKEGVSILPNATLGGGQMGLDAPFGSAALRFFNDAPGGNLQFVAPNGGLDMYLGGVNVFSLNATSATFNDGTAINFGTTNGTKIGNSTSQKIGFFGATPVVQQTAGVDIGTVLSNLGLRAVGTAYPVTTTGQVSIGTGGFRSNPAVRTANITLTSSSAWNNIVDATSGNITITLPAANSVAGQMLFFKRIDNTANTVTIQRAGSDGVEGGTSYSLSAQYKYVELMNDNATKWYIKDNN